MAIPCAIRRTPGGILNGGRDLAAAALPVPANAFLTWSPGWWMGAGQRPPPVSVYGWLGLGMSAGGTCAPDLMSAASLSTCVLMSAGRSKVSTWEPVAAVFRLERELPGLD